MTDMTTSYVRREATPSRAKRKIPLKSGRSFVGELVLNIDGRRQSVGFESKLEHDCALIAAYRPGFVDITEQLEGVRVRLPGGRTKLHHLDFLLTQAGPLGEGKVRTAIAVKMSRYAAAPLFQAEMEALKKEIVPRLADRLCFVTEHCICPVELANAKLFHCCRDPETTLDDLVRRRPCGPSSRFPSGIFSLRTGSSPQDTGPLSA